MRNIYSLMFCLFAISQLFAQEFNGYWEAEGYGQIFEISDTTLDVYAYNSKGVVYEGSTSINGNQVLGSSNVLGELSFVDDKLILSIVNGLEAIDYTYTAITDLPQIIQPTDDPVTNFDVFWTMFEEYCSLFEFLPLDWNAQYDFYRPQINENTTDEELFGFMANMIGELDDAHCFLRDEANDRDFNSGHKPDSFWQDYAGNYIELLQSKYIDVANIQTFADNQIVVSTLAEGTVGYLFLSTFGLEADGQIDENNQFTEIIDAALELVKDTESLIIDVRNNGGGAETNARILANRLTKINQTVYTKQVRVKEAYDAFSEPRDINIYPEGIQYIDRPVVVLTSNVTASAADVFALMAKEIDCVTTIGNLTYGIFSDVTIRNLPNKWYYSFSAERYLDLNGNNLEQVGVTPDIIVKEDLDALLDDDIDNVLEYAIATIGSSCTVSSLFDYTEEVSQIAYPNPFTHRVFIDDSLEIDASSKASIFNISGDLVYHQPLESGGMLELGELSNGMYTLVVETASQTIMNKIVKIGI